MTSAPFVLASASPARAATLRAAGVEPRILVSSVDEQAVLAQATPAGVAEAVAVLAQAKAEDVAARLGDDSAIVLGCDSLLEFDGRQFGKPANAQQATQRWQLMRGRSAVLYTGHHLIYQGQQLSEVGATTVHFANISDAELAAYVATGEPLHVAGAFTIDGYAGPFIERIEGDHHNVLGLSLPLLRSMLQRVGVIWHDLWSTH